MDRNPRLCIHFLIALAAIGLMIALEGCASVSTMNREGGFNMQARGFASIPETPGLVKMIHVDFYVLLVGDRESLDKVTGMRGTAGFYDPKRRVMGLWAKQTPFGIIPCFGVDGHELKHVLEYQSNGLVINPDRLTEYGY
jgi:hypothetical protein